MSEKRRPLARLRKFHKGKRGISQMQSHRANLHRGMRGDKRRDLEDAATHGRGRSE